MGFKRVRDVVQMNTSSYRCARSNVRLADRAKALLTISGNCCVQDMLVNDLKQQLAHSEAARTQAENQLIELRITQKAVGQPTEVWLELEPLYLFS